MKYILALDKHQADRYMREHNLVPRKDAEVISHANYLRGVTLREDDVVRVGAYYLRDDITEIEENIRYCTHL